MNGEQNGDKDNVHQEPDFAQAFQELARGERAATALENHLTSLEKKIDELLAKADEEDKTRMTQAKDTKKPSSSGDESTSSN